MSEIISEQQLCYDTLLKLHDAHNRLIEVLKRYVSMTGGQVLVQDALDKCRVERDAIDDLLRYRQIVDAQRENP